MLFHSDELYETLLESSLPLIPPSVASAILWETATGLPLLLERRAFPSIRISWHFAHTPS